MNIALIAHDNKKELMAEFCLAYVGVLKNHHLCATASTAAYVMETTGLEVEKLFSGVEGGVQQIEARITYNEIDVVLFFDDTSKRKRYMEEVTPVMCLCDANNIPVATNIAPLFFLIISKAA